MVVCLNFYKYRKKKLWKLKQTNNKAKNRVNSSKHSCLMIRAFLAKKNVDESSTQEGILILNHFLNV